MPLQLPRLALIILLLLCALLPQLAPAAGERRVLILNSYHQGMEWTDDEVAGIKSRLAGFGPVDIRIEYMDAKRLVDQNHFENLRQLFAHKYRADQPSAIVVTDNDAFDFMRRYRDELFPGVPVVFCGVNQFSDDQLAGLSGFTGIAETADNAATIELMRRLHPDTERIVVIVDTTTTGKAVRAELELLVSRRKGALDFEFWDSVSLPELPSHLSALPAKTLVLLMPYASDRDGRFITHVEMTELVARHSPVPVYASWEMYLGHGIVGGKLTTAKAQGNAAGEMLLRTLNGERADNIPIRYDVPGAFAFDYRQLVRFNIPESQLPEDSTLVFQPWHQTNQVLIWSGTALAAILIGLLWALLASMARKRQADAALRENMAVLQSRDNALREISEGVLIASPDRILTFANKAVERISGYDMNELLGRSCSMLQGPETSEVTKLQIRAALDAAQPFQGEVLNYRKDGTTFWNALSISPVFDQRGRLTQFVGIQSDVTARKLAEVELRIAAKAFEAQVAMLVADANGMILRVNHAFTQTTGYSAEEAIGQKTSLLKSGRHDKAFYEQFWAALQEEHYWQGVIWNRRKNDSIYAEWLTVNAVLTPTGEITHYVCSFSDITQNKEAEAEVHRLAYYDPLTQLPNRRLLQDRLGQALASATRSQLHGAVLFLDLDHFNTINDTRGHDTGDRLLVQVAQRLRAALRESDTVARPGGDEFVVILEDISKDAEEAASKAMHIGSHLRTLVGQPYKMDALDYVCTASIGICLFRDKETVEQLLQNADISMYQAKAGGRNTVRFFDPEMQAALDRRSRLENDLRQALERNEFHLYYQPQMNRSGRVTGAEILLRWKHPQRHFVSPADFIPMAETTGLILPIGQWVLDSACQQIKAWSDHPEASALRLSVNVSSLQFHQDDFVGSVRQALLDSGIDSSRLKLELTESMVLDDVENTISKMHVLKDSGVTFSMDDFGTGYSSLAYLTRLPLDELKIDQSFVANLPGNHNDGVIAQTILTMARSLGLSVVAEGVETEAQRAFLDAHGCPGFQGYLYSRPLPLDEFMAYLTLTNDTNGANASDAP